MAHTHKYGSVDGYLPMSSTVFAVVLFVFTQKNTKLLNITCLLGLMQVHCVLIKEGGLYLDTVMEKSSCM